MCSGMQGNNGLSVKTLRTCPPCKSMGCGAFANFACISSLVIKHFFESEEMIVAVNAIYAIA